MRCRLLLPAVFSLLWSPTLFAAPIAKPVEWTIGGDTFAGVLVYDDAVKQPRPGLVMVPNWKGVNDSAIEKARLVAGDDYVVLVADVYGKGIRPKTDAEAGPVATAMRMKGEASFEKNTTVFLVCARAARPQSMIFFRAPAS